MRHRRAGKSLSRSVSHRRALRRNMASSLIENGTIRTTEVKAKELRRFVEKLITIAKKGTLAARRQVIRELQDRAMAERDEDGQIVFDKHGLAALQEQTVVQKLFDDVAPRYANRDGGYTRIIRVADRRIGDAGKQVILMLVEEEGETGSDRKKPGRRRKKAERRYAMASAAAKSSAAPVTAEEPDTEEEVPADAEATPDSPAEETDQAPADQAEGDEQDNKSE